MSVGIWECLLAFGGVCWRQLVSVGVLGCVLRYLSGIHLCFSDVSGGCPWVLSKYKVQLSHYFGKAQRGRIFLSDHNERSKYQNVYV